MKVSCDEGVASHVGPESCVGVPEDVGEALTGESAGRVLSLENLIVRSADDVASLGRQQRRFRHRKEHSYSAWSKAPREGYAFPCTHQSISHRIADNRVMRHVQKWLNAGVVEEGQRTRQEEGTPNGGSISPLLANIYLHYVFDLWADPWRKTQSRGDVIIVRHADDFVVGFQHESDGGRLLEDLRERVRQFNLELQAGKTRVIEFGRFASERRARRGQGKPQTFNFLGFTHACDRTRKGKFIVLRRTMAKRMHAKLKSLKEALRRGRHLPVGEVGRWLGRVLLGHYRYYGVPRNYAALDLFRHRVRKLWQRAMSLRGQRGRISEARMNRIVACWLPNPCRNQPYPSERLAVMIQGKSPVR